MKALAIHSQIISPNHDYSFSWQVHGGLSGHIPYEERSKQHKIIQHRSSEQIKEGAGTLNGQKFISLYRTIYEHLHSNLGKSGKLLSDVIGQPFEGLNISIVTGYSRSGGTYATNELAKLNNIQLKKRHIWFCHDFYPIFSFLWNNQLNGENYNILIDYLRAPIITPAA